MKNKLFKSVLFGWLITTIGIFGPIIAYNYPELAPDFMLEHIVSIFFISVLLLVLRYSKFGPIYQTARNAAKITMLAYIVQLFTTGRFSDRMNPFIIGVVVMAVMIMGFQILCLVFVCWYYLVRETIYLVKLMLAPRNQTVS